MKVIIIALALALLSVLPAAAAVAVPSCPTDITVGSGQYVKLSTTPVDPGIYYYYWYSTVCSPECLDFIYSLPIFTFFF